MVDIKDNLESEKLTDNINKEEIHTLEDSMQENTLENSLEDNNILDNKIENEKNNENDNSDIVNCLALTVQKDYSLAIAKNVVLKALKSTWKIVLSIFTLNFLKFFL